jgi:CheY-like chemotaxis protein
VILLSLALPELPGLEFLRHLKAMDSTREIPVIVLGASPDSQPDAAEGCVPNPLEGERVMTEVGRCLQCLQPSARHYSGAPIGSSTVTSPNSSSRSRPSI